LLVWGKWVWVVATRAEAIVKDVFDFLDALFEFFDIG
jgi:hypothetical protein